MAFEERDAEVARELLGTMIGNSQQPEAGNHRFNEVIAETLNEVGLHTYTVPDPEYSDRALLLVDIGEANATQALGLISHCDVVGVPGDQDWHTNPHKLEEKAGKLIGRGACDTHGSAVAMLIAATQPEIQQLLDKTGQKLTLAFTYDEEAGDHMSFRGVMNAAGLLPNTPASLTAPYFIAGEPTEVSGVNRATRASKGRWSAELTFNVEHPGHTAQDVDDANAFAFKVGSLLYDFNGRLRGNNRLIPEDIVEIFSDDVPYSTLRIPMSSMTSGLPSTTVGNASFYCDLRTMPTVHDIQVDALKHLLSDLRPYMQEEGCELDYEERDVFPASATPADSLIVHAAEAATGQTVMGFSAGEEGQVMRGTGKAGITFGPGSLAVAHGANEYVTIDSILDAATIYADIFQRILTSS